MSRIVTYTPVDLRDVVEFAPKKTPLTELVRAAGVGRANTRSAHLTLEAIRSNLVTSDSLEEFEATDSSKGIFGWFERRRRQRIDEVAEQPSSVTILPATSIFATSRR